jgi:hypothetical protein
MKAILLLICLIFCSISHAQSTDAFQYETKRSATSKFMYSQMWYFNFLDEKNDLAGVFAAGVGNPKGTYKLESVTTTVSFLFEKQNQFAAWGPRWNARDPKNFSASSTFKPSPGPEFRNPGFLIDVISTDEYQIRGETRTGDGKIIFDLNYKRAKNGLGAPWKAWSDWPLPKVFGTFKSWISYHLHLPYAVVNGTITVADRRSTRSYKVEDAKGYYDGFFGEMVFSKLEWDWVDFKTDNVAVHLLSTHKPIYSCRTYKRCTPGDLRVLYREGGEVKTSLFSGPRSELSVTYLEVVRDSSNPKLYQPTQVLIRGKNNENDELNLIWTRKRVLRVDYDVPWPFPDAHTYEFISEIQGTIQSGKTGFKTEFSGTGWTDTSALSEKDLKRLGISLRQ